jgi:hypothetical protein
VRKIEYKPGQIIGSYGAEYFRDVYTADKQRCCEFICVYCGGKFKARLSNVKQDRTTSCGCARFDEWKKSIQNLGAK